MRMEWDVSKYKWESDWWNAIYNEDGSLKAQDDPKKTLLGNAVSGIEYGYEWLEEFFSPNYTSPNDDWTY